MTGAIECAAKHKDVMWYSPEINVSMLSGLYLKVVFFLRDDDSGGRIVVAARDRSENLGRNRLHSGHRILPDQL